jgi:hypothetical protein
MNVSTGVGKNAGEGDHMTAVGRVGWRSGRESEDAQGVARVEFTGSAAATTKAVHEGTFLDAAYRGIPSSGDGRTRIRKNEPEEKEKPGFVV